MLYGKNVNVALMDCANWLENLPNDPFQIRDTKKKLKRHV